MSRRVQLTEVQWKCIDADADVYSSIYFHSSDVQEVRMRFFIVSKRIEALPYILRYAYS